ncbi:hypothetical protein [Metabacillus halosaccharovorans]|uniref:DUF2178 domain-containing protein n=1 Tax=Metabacillus halosaccharovorans TaxID=930124 RepID=A0ABT3DN07_9BACI|nr:hypothetical protein [Metabacillus halosaccharovorans]MCV9887997.1 hypothetical protein [Metabacillus halosaccharovorans]
MKKIFQPAILNIVTIILFGWALVMFYEAQMQFADIIKDPEPPWEISVNILPLLLFIMICIPISIYFIAKGKKKHKSMWKAFMLPPELEEADEREQMITAKACRSSYIAMWYTAPIAAGLLLFYPLIQENIPYYPIIILLLLPVVQMISYFHSLHKNL